MIQLKVSNTAKKQNVDGGVDGQIPAFLVRVLAHDVLVRNKRGHRAMSVPMPPKLVPMIRSRHWSQKPESRIVVGTLLMTWLDATATSSGWPPTSERASW